MEIITIPLALIESVVVAFIAAFAFVLLENNGHFKSDDPDKNGLKAVRGRWPLCIALGVCTGAITVLQARVLVLYQFGLLQTDASAIWLMLGLLIATIAVAVIWVVLTFSVWAKETSRASEMILFFVLAIGLFFITQAGFNAAGAFFGSHLWNFVAWLVPVELLILSFGVPTASWLAYRRDEVDVAREGDTEREIVEKEDQARRDNVWCRVVTIATAVLMVLALIFGFVTMDPLKGFGTSQPAKAATTTQSSEAAAKPATGAKSEAKTWYYFDNADLQRDSDKSNDYNFANDRYKEGAGVEYYLADFSGLFSRNPAILSATALSLDGTLGTDYIGQILYLGYDQKLGVLARADAATRALMGDQKLSNDVASAVYRKLVSADEIRLVELDDIKDQVFMDPYTVDGVPSIVIYESAQKSGLCLEFTWHVKGSEETTVKIAYRIACGYQWTNGAEKLGVTPEPMPTPSPTPTPTPDPGPTPTPDPDPDPTPDPDPDPDPEPTPDPTPSYDKDKTKGTKVNTEPNDDPGDGPNTNNGKGATKSKEDDPTGSTSYSSPEEVKKQTKELEEINDSQKQSGDSNKPSTPTPAGTNVDNNGDKGTGHGSADDPTGKHSTKYADGSSGSSGSDGAWGGPPD